MHLNRQEQFVLHDVLAHARDRARRENHQMGVFVAYTAPKTFFVWSTHPDSKDREMADCPPDICAAVVGADGVICFHEAFGGHVSYSADED